MLKRLPIKELFSWVELEALAGACKCCARDVDRYPLSVGDSAKIRELWWWTTSLGEHFLSMQCLKPLISL